MSASNPPTVGQVWREDDGYLVKVVAVEPNRVWVRAVTGFAGNFRPGARSSQVNPAWFEHWTLVSS